MKAFTYLLIVALIICGWSPWFEEGEAKQLIYNKVRESQSTLQAGCVLTIDPTSIHKTAFGYTQTVAYNCTLDTDFLTKGTNTVFVSFFKLVINVPHPIIK